MGARGGRAAARKGSKHSSSLKDGHLLASSSSDRIEGSFSSNSQSCCSISDPTGAVYLIQGGNQDHVQYINSEGSIFTLASNSNHFPAATNKLDHHRQQSGLQQQQQELSYSSKTHSTDSVNSLSTANNLVAASRRQQPIDLLNSNQNIQHRRLQQQVHQQLQIIYDNSGKQGQPLSGQAVLTSERNQQPLKQRRNSQQQQQQHSISESNPMKNDHLIEFGNRGRQQHSMMANSKQPKQEQQEQTYDSLSPASMISKSYCHQQADGFGCAQHNSYGQAHISSIPEEGNFNEDELLLPGDSGASCETNRVAIHRKNHLEDLHYATVTAAALLSATANAAAALAATSTRTTNKQRSNIELQVEVPAVEQSLDTIYSEAHQEIKRQRVCHDETKAVVARHKQQQKQQQAHLYRAPTHTDLASARRSAVSTNARYGPNIANKVPQPQPKIYNVVQPVLQAGQQQLLQQLLRPVNYGRPPQPPMRRLPPNNNQYQFDPMSSQTEWIRQHQIQRHRLLQQQLERDTQMRQAQPKARTAVPGAIFPPAVPALAIIHHRNPMTGSEGGVSSQAAEADPISQLLVNRFVSAQRAAAAVAAAANVEPTQYMQYSFADKGSGVRNDNKLAKVGNIQALVNRNTIDPLTYAVNLGNREKLYASGQKGQIFSLPNMVAPSDSSGHSSVPLVLDRNIRPLGFIGRICQIDLTIFWWSLIIVCFLFIGTTISISRYLL